MGLRLVLRLATIGVLAAIALPGAARAAGPCDSYPEQLSPAELHAYGVALKYGFPAMHAERLSRVRLENGRDPRLLGPHVQDRAGPSPVVEIPPGFRRLQCKLLRVHDYYEKGCCDRREDVGTIVHRCLTRTDEWRRCIEQWLDERIAREEPRYPADRAHLELLVEAAFQYTLAHEAAHVLASAAGAGLATDLDDETAADLLAQTALVPEGHPPSPSIATLAMLSIADRSIDWSRQAHPPFACRARLAEGVVSKIYPEVEQLYVWLISTAEDYAARRAAPRRLEPAFIPGDTSGCTESPPAALDSVRRDFDRLLATLDGIVAESAPPAPEEVVRRLTAVPLATGEGRRMQTNLASLWALNAVKLDVDNGPAALAASAARLERLLAGLNPEAMTSEGYGRLLVNRAVTLYHQTPAGAGLDSTNARLREELEQAERYYARSSYAKLYLGRVAFMQGRCAEGRAAFQALASFNSDNPSYVRDLEQFLTAESPAQCAAAARRLEQAVKVQFGRED